jgi:hypothetical protein
LLFGIPKISKEKIIKIKSCSPIEMQPRKPIHTLIDDSMFMTLEQFGSKEIKEKIDDKEKYQKTVREMLSNALKEKLKLRK